MSGTGVKREKATAEEKRAADMSHKLHRGLDDLKNRDVDDHDEPARPTL